MRIYFRMALNSCSSNRATTNSSCNTDVRVDQVNFTWTINHIDFHMKKKDSLRSSAFSSPTNNAFKWILKLQFNRDEDETDETNDSVSLGAYLVLSRFSKRRRAFAKYSFTAFGDQHMEIKNLQAPIQEFNTKTESWGWKVFLENNYVFRSSVTEGKLTITCKVEFSEMNDVSRSFYRSKLKVSECNLSEDLKSFIKNQEFADVTLSVNGKDYPAHKLILAARSPVFAAMFRHEMVENQQNLVTIEDMSEEVMDEMLRYIYTGKCENIDKLAHGLLTAADRYALDRLKVVCSEALCKSLTVEKAPDVLVLADIRGMNDLKSEVVKFIVSKFNEVLNTNAWKSILSSNAELVNEVCQAVARQ